MTYREDCSECGGMVREVMSMVYKRVTYRENGVTKRRWKSVGWICRFGHFRNIH